MDKNSSYFVKWVPKNCMVGMTRKSLSREEHSACFLTNTGTVVEILQRVVEAFSAMY